MRIGAAPAALALAVALAGCPLPQPLPDYPAGTVIPAPRILVDEILVGGRLASAQPVILVPAGCPAGREPEYALSARIFDTNTIEQVEARWFVNYHPQFPLYSTSWREDTIPADPNTLVLTRDVPPFAFAPYGYPPPFRAPSYSGPPWKQAGDVRVVELVVSNGFDPTATSWPAAALPNRTPAALHETQVYRWVFLTVAASADGCDPAEPDCVPCP